MRSLHWHDKQVKEEIKVRKKLDFIVRSMNTDRIGQYMDTHDARRLEDMRAEICQIRNKYGKDYLSFPSK